MPPPQPAIYAVPGYQPNAYPNGDLSYEFGPDCLYSLQAIPRSLMVKVLATDETGQWTVSTDLHANNWAC
ncbi:hypothetical protein P0D72_07800 [Paraburkholderia sediminicola]|uniref:hypothetical protein n=1 Tax=Paraburkholderia TaxID=1822464 RepID=UPI0038B945A7